jgi:hypothetical protein
MDNDAITGAFIGTEQMFVARTMTRFISEVGTSRPTMYKIFRGDFTVRPQVIIAIEQALSWPYGSIDAIRRLDWQWLETEGFPADSLSRLRKVVAKHSGESDEMPS